MIDYGGQMKKLTHIRKLTFYDKIMMDFLKLVKDHLYNPPGISATLGLSRPIYTGHTSEAFKKNCVICRSYTYFLTNVSTTSAVSNSSPCIRLSLVYVSSLFLHM